MMIRIIGMFFLMSALNAQAAVYMTESVDGSITYSDKPVRGAEEVPAEELVAVPPVKIPSKVESEKAIDDKLGTPPTDMVSYTLFEVSSPTQNQTFQNQPTISLVVEVQPALQEGDKVQAYVDGTARGLPVASLTVNLGRLERGGHTVFATLLDRHGKEIKRSREVTIFVHQASVARKQNTTSLLPIVPAR